MASSAQAANGLLEPRPTWTFPSLGTVLDEGEQPPTNAASSDQPTPELTPLTKRLSEQLNASKPAPITEGVSKKADDHTSDQIRAKRPEDGNFPRNKGANLLNGDLSDDEEWNTDPYQERADAIGLSHRIPGVGHLGDLLTPPGWKPGDEPIHPKKARQLYRDAYDTAKKNLADSIAEFKDLKGSAFQEASDLKNEEWQNQIMLYKLIFDERVKVYQEYQDRREQPIRQERPKQFPVLNLPQSNGRSFQPVPAVVVSRARDERHLLPTQAVFLPPSANGPEPSPKILSPSFLDPDLIHGTVESVIQGYHLKKAQLEHEANDNELRLKQCLIKYGPRLVSQYQQVQQNQQNQPEGRRILRKAHAPVGNGVGMETYGNQSDHNEDRGLTTYRYPEPPAHNALVIYDEPVELALSSPAKSSPTKTQHGGETTPRPAKRQARAKSGSSKQPSPKKATPSKVIQLTSTFPILRTNHPSLEIHEAR